MTVGDRWLVLDSVGSTQSEAARLLAAGEAPDVILALEQTDGRGRLGRRWSSQRGSSLTMSLVLHGYLDHHSPWLLGMAAAIAAAKTFQGTVRWPNDVHRQEGKVAGILTEVWKDSSGRRCAVVGIGANLRPFSLPEGVSAGFDPLARDPEAAAKALVASLESGPEPGSWADLEPEWSRLDATPGKRYRLPDGTTVTAVGVGTGGALMAEGEQGPVRVLAAEAILD